MLVIKIQSASDIITNSSSEIFQLKSDLSLDVVRQMIKEEGSKNLQFDLDECSGMGCLLEVWGWEEVYERSKEWAVVVGKKDQYTPEIWSLRYEESLEELKSRIWVDIDWNRTATIDFILRNFWVVETDEHNEYMQIDPSTKKVIRIVTKDMYEQLPESERYQHEN